MPQGLIGVGVPAEVLEVSAVSEVLGDLKWLAEEDMVAKRFTW